MRPAPADPVSTRRSPHPYEAPLRQIAFWLPLGICTWMALGSGLPSAAPKVSDVTLHLLAFVYLTVALRIAKPALVLWRVCVFLLLYGAFIEIAQGFLPSRQSEWKDFAVDAIGVSVGVVTHRYLGETVWRAFLRLVRLADGTKQ